MSTLRCPEAIRLFIILVVLCFTTTAQTRVYPRQVRDWRQVQPLVGNGQMWKPIKGLGTQIAVDQLRIDPALLVEWRHESIGPCVTYAVIGFAPGSGPYLITGIGMINIETEEAFYRYKTVWKFWFKVPQ
jgi:hypothetical protein